MLNWGTLWRSALDPLFAVGWTVGQPATRGRSGASLAPQGASAGGEPCGGGFPEHLHHRAEVPVRDLRRLFSGPPGCSLRALLEVSGDGHGNVTEAGHHGCLQLGPATAAVAAALSGLDLAVHRRVSEVGVQDLTATEAKEGSRKSGCTGPARSCRNS